MIVLGLTGSIGMGKSTAAKIFRDLGVPVHESDASVHEALSTKCAANHQVRRAFPASNYPQIYEGEKINRPELGKIVFKNTRLRKKLEQILHPHVQDSQKKFIAHQKKKITPLVVLDIPLLYETGADKRVDYVLVVSAPKSIQRARVLARPGMSEEKFRAILSHQMPDAEKRKRADFVVKTGLGLAHTRKEIKKIIKELEQKTK